MKPFNRFLNSAWFYRLMALILAILMVIYVTNTAANDTRLARPTNGSRISSLTSTKTATISVPLQLNVNSNKYFVTGYPERVKVKVTGPAALVTATTNTQNFTINANLRGLSMGKHKVKLVATGLNKELTYQIQPQNINVTIARRATVTLPVHVKYDASNLASGYQIGTPSSSVTKVTVTGASDQVEQVAQVVAPVNLTKNSTSTLNVTAQLEAQDSNGRTVNVVITPATTTVKIPITSDESSKKVTVKYSAVNGAGDRNYDLSGDVDSLVVYGTKSAIDKLKDTITIPVDVSGLPLGTSKQQVNLTPSAAGLRSYSITSAAVTIKVTAVSTDAGAQGGTSSTTSTGESSATSSSASDGTTSGSSSASSGS